MTTATTWDGLGDEVYNEDRGYRTAGGHGDGVAAKSRGRLRAGSEHGEVARKTRHAIPTVGLVNNGDWPTANTTVWAICSVNESARARVCTLVKKTRVRRRRKNAYASGIITTCAVTVQVVRWPRR